MIHLKEAIMAEAEKISKELIDIRRDFHTHPEIGFSEKRTAKFVCEYLKKLGVEVESGVAGTGVVGLLRGKYEGKTILLRADMDCLKLNECGNTPYKSQNPGYMHACGHDAHTAWLLGAAHILSLFRDELHGNVKFLFQPAEEFGGGAIKCIDDGVLDNPHVEAVIGAHIWPDVPSGMIGIKKGALMAATDFFDITISGKGGHGAEPQNCIDPISVGCQIYNSIQTIVSRRISPFEQAVVTIGKFNAGTASNIIPDKAEISGTVRTLDSSVQNKIYDLMRSIVQGISKANSAESEINYNMYHPPINNDEAMTGFIAHLAEELWGNAAVRYIENGSMTGEDFAHYQKRVPGIFFWMGTRNEDKGINFPLHSSNFDIDEEVIHKASALFAYAALKFCNFYGE